MSVKKTDAWMPLWIGAYLADTLSLTTIQHGAYMLLLMAYWRERSALPDDDDQLRSIAKMDRAEWKKAKPVLSRFFRIEGGRWSHKRVEIELAAAEQRSKHASEKATKAAQARWKECPKDAPSMPQALLEDVPDECPTPSPVKTVSIPSVSHPAEPGKTPAGTIPCPYADIVSAYHEALPSLPKARLMPVKRQAALRKFWGWVLGSRKSDGTKRAETSEQALAWVAGYFARAGQNDFLMGRSARSEQHAGWQCDLDYLLSDKGLKQVIEKTREAA